MVALSLAWIIVRHSTKDEAAFYVVYIQEAHPVDGWQRPGGAMPHTPTSVPSRKAPQIRPL